MLASVPAWIEPTETTAASIGSTAPARKVCSAFTIAQAAGIGLRDRCGAEPWPPLPCTVTESRSEADIRQPARVANRPRGHSAELTCSA